MIDKPVLDKPVTPPARAADWSFLLRPFWLFSHLFALTVVVSFVLLGFWQLNRHHERDAANAIVAAHSSPPALDAADVVDRSPADLDYQLVTAQGTYVSDDVVRVANRSQGGVAGEYLVSTFQLDNGGLLLVNRGFVPLEPVPVTPAPSGPVTIQGWLRASVTRERFGAADLGTGSVVPRLDVDAIAGRLGQSLIPVWLQLEGESGFQPATFPDPVPLPTLDGGPHVSYMLQWWTFAVLGVGFYLALVRITARRQVAPPPADDEPTGDSERAQTPRSPTASA